MFWHLKAGMLFHQKILLPSRPTDAQTVLFNCTVLEPDGKELISHYSVLVLLLFHNKVFQSTNQLETITRATHRPYKAGSVQRTTVTEMLITCNESHSQLLLFDEANADRAEVCSCKYHTSD